MEFINSAQCVVLTIKLSLIPILTICHNSNVIHFHTGIDRIGRATKNTQIKKTQANPKWQSVIYLFCSISSDRMKLQMKTAKQHTNKKKSTPSTWCGGYILGIPHVMCMRMDIGIGATSGSHFYQCFWLVHSSRSAMAVYLSGMPVHIHTRLYVIAIDEAKKQNKKNKRFHIYVEMLHQQSYIQTQHRQIHTMAVCGAVWVDVLREYSWSVRWGICAFVVAAGLVLRLNSRWLKHNNRLSSRLCHLYLSPYMYNRRMCFLFTSMRTWCARVAAATAMKHILFLYSRSHHRSCWCCCCYTLRLNGTE